MRTKATAVAKWVRIGAVVFVALVLTGRPGSVVSADEDRAESRVSDAKIVAIEGLGPPPHLLKEFVERVEVDEQVVSGVTRQAGAGLAGSESALADDQPLIGCQAGWHRQRGGSCGRARS